QLRQMLSTHKDLKKKIETMEKKYDQQFQIVFEAIKQLLEADAKPRKKIGFTVKEKQKAYGKSIPKKALDEFSLTPQAFRIWINIPGDFQMKLLNNVWCRTCSDITGIGSVSGKIEKGVLILRGICTRCGNPVGSTDSQGNLYTLRKPGSPCNRKRVKSETKGQAQTCPILSRNQRGHEGHCSKIHRNVKKGGWIWQKTMAPDHG
ncbi:MAG: hypothetical protein JRJ76_16000, partial [Deltaproteobacteria bacterium]|nr:hypothetical protein [Deltaproteobacteria bacterium]